MSRRFPNFGRARPPVRGDSRPVGVAREMALPGSGRVAAVAPLTRAIAREIQALTAPGASIEAPWKLAKLLVPDITDAELDALAVTDIRRLCDVAARLES